MRLTGTLDNRTGVVPASLDNGLHALNPLLPGLELTAAPLALAKLHRHC